MGAKTWMIAYSNGPIATILKSRPALDRQASAALAKKLFPAPGLDQLDDGSLSFQSA